MKYFEWIDALSGIYLEDSYVLAIRERRSEIEFEMEFVLRPNHIFYAEPKNDEMYCYRRGLIRLSDCADIVWKKRSYVDGPTSTEGDFGNIDTFSKNGNRISLTGDWGDLSLISDEILVFIVL